MLDPLKYTRASIGFESLIQPFSTDDFHLQNLILQPTKTKTILTRMAITHRQSFTTDAEESMEFHVPCSPPPRSLKLKKAKKLISARLSFTSKALDPDEDDEVVHLDFDIKEESEQDPKMIRHSPDMTMIA